MPPQNPRQSSDPEIDRILSGYVKDKVNEEADRQGIPRDYAQRIAQTESAYKPDVIKGQRRSSAGAIGPMQVMPGTAKDLKIDPYNINQNIEGGVRYAGEQLRAFGNDQRKASAAYNWGPGNVRKYGVERAPAETQNYMRNVAGQSQQADPEIENLLKQYQQEKGAQQQPAQTRTYPKQYMGSETDPAKQKADKANWSRQFSTNFDINEVGPGSTTDNPPKITPVPRAPQQPSTQVRNVFNKTLEQDQRAATGDARAALDFRNASTLNDATRLTAKVAQAEQFNRAQPGDAARRKRIEETRQRVAGRSIIGRTAEKVATQFALNSPEWLTPEAKADVEERAIALGLEPAKRDEWLYKPATQIGRAGAQTAAMGVQGAAEIGDVIRRRVPGVQSTVNTIGDTFTGDGSTEARAQSLLRNARALPGQAQQITPLADPNDQSWLGAKIPAALGSSAVFGPIGAAGQAARLSAPLISGMTGAIIGAGSSAQKADKAKIPQDRRDASVLFGAGTGATEAAGFERFLGGAGRIAKPAQAIGQDVAQEYAQQYLEDVNDRYIGGTDPNASMNPLSGNKLEAAALGGIVSGMRSSPQIAGDAIAARQSRADAQRVAREPQRPMNLTPTAVGPTERVKVTPGDFQRANLETQKGFTEPLTEPLAPPQVAPTAPIAPAANAAPAAAGMPNRADFEPGFLGDVEYQAALADAQRAPKAAKAGAKAAARDAAKPQFDQGRLRQQVINAQVAAQEAEQAGNYRAAAPKYKSALDSLGQMRADAKRQGNEELYATLSEEMDVARANMMAARKGQSAARTAGKAEINKPLPVNEIAQAERRMTPDVQIETAPTRDLSAPLPASVEAAPLSQPENAAPAAPKPARGLQRNFRAGMNDGGMVFESENQRDLFDLGAALRGGGLQGGRNRNYQQESRIKPLYESLQQRLGLSRDEVQQLAMDTHNDVRGQMKGVKHLEERRLVDNLKPKPPAREITNPNIKFPTNVESQNFKNQNEILTPQTNRITEGAGDELPRRVSRPLAGQPAEVPEAPPAAADRLARLRAAAQQAPPMELAQPERPAEAPPVNDRLERLKRIANQVNQQFAQPEQPAPQPEAPKAQPELVAAAKRPPAPTGEPKLSNRTVKQSLQEEMGATSTNRSDKLRLSGPSENYREVVTRWEDAPEGTVFRKPEHYGDETNVLFDRRLEDRKTTNGDNAVFFMEAQSDWHQSKDAPPAPLKNTWLRRALDDTAREAAEAGQDGVLLPKTVEQLYEIQRWGAVKEKDGRYTNSEGFDITPVVRRYLKELPDLARKAASKNGVKLETRTVDDGRGGKEELWFLPVKKTAKPAETAPVAEVKAPIIAPEEAEYYRQQEEQEAAPQSDVERRRLMREGAPKGEFGKLSEYARTRATEDRALAGSDELRDLLGLPEMPPYLSEETGKTTEWSKAAQETMDALAELAGFDRQRSSQMGLEGLRDAWKGLQAKAKSLNVQISADLKDRFIHTAKTYQVAFLEPYKRLHESNEVVDNALRRIEEIYEQKRPLTTKETRQLYRTLRDEFVKEGLTENYFRKTYWPSIKEAAEAYSGEVRQARRAGNRRDVQVDEPATGTDGRSAEGGGRAAVQEAKPVKPSANPIVRPAVEGAEVARIAINEQESKGSGQYNGLDYRVANDGTVSVAHSVTGRGIGTINLNTGEVIPANTKYAERLNAVHNHLKQKAADALREEEIGRLKNYPARNAAEIKRLEDERTATAGEAKPAEKPARPVTPAASQAEGAAANLSRQEWGQVKHDPNTGLYWVTTFDDVGATREGYSLGRSQGRGKQKRTVAKTFESKQAAETYLDKLYARELKAGRIPAAPEKINVPSWVDREGNVRPALGEVEILPQTAQDKEDGFRRFRPVGEDKQFPRGGTIEEAWYQSAKQSTGATPAPTFDTLAQKMAEVSPNAADGALTSIRDLRQAMRAELPTKEAFDQFLLQQAREDKIALHHHDHPSSLTDAERAEMVQDERGNYYIGAALREPAAKASAPEAVKPTPTERKTVARAAKAEKISNRTGLTPTQENYVADKLQNEVLPEYLETQKPKRMTIEVPGDGKFTVEDITQANNLHYRVTGKPINEALTPTVKRSALGKPPMRDADLSGQDIAKKAAQAYGSPEKALESLTKQVAAFGEDLPAKEYSKFTQAIAELKDTVEEARQTRAREAGDRAATMKKQARQAELAKTSLPERMAEARKALRADESITANQLVEQFGLTKKQANEAESRERLHPDAARAFDGAPSREFKASEKFMSKPSRFSFGPLENEPSGPVATMFGGQKILDSLRAGRRPVGATKEAPRTPEDWDVADYIKKHVAQLKPSKRADGTVIRPELPLTEAQGRELASTVSRLVAASSKNDRAEMFQAKTQIDNLVMAAKRASRRQDPIAKLRPELTEARRWAEDKYKDGKISESHKDNVLRAATALEAAGKLRIPADIQTARRELLNAKRDVRADDKWKRRAYKIGDTAAQTVRGAQTAVFGSDWSYIFRQGGPVALNPMNVFNTFKAFQMAYHAQGRESAQPQGKLGVFSKAFVGSKGAEWVRDQIKNHPAYEDAVRADLKLALTTEAEEIYKDNYVAKLPWIKRTEAANEAALDWLRLSEFTRYKKQIDAQKGERTFAQRQKDLERAAETINTLTGRTDLGEGRIKKAVDFLNGWMSAPRLNVSRVKILDPTRIAREYAKSPATAKRMTKDAILTVAPWAAAIALGNAAGIWSSTLDYDDPDFGKIKVGDTRYDVGFGLLPLLRLYLKAAEYGSKAANDAVRQTAATKKARKDAGEIAGQAAKTYVRGRLGPLASYANDQWWGSNIIGEEVTPRQILANPLTEKQSPVRRLVIPVTYGEMGEMGWKYGAQRKAEGTGGIIKGAAAGVARGLPGMVGFGVQDYEKKPRRKIGASR